MRLYEKGEKVRFGDGDDVGTVLERYDEPYKLPEGQAIGGAPGATYGGHAHYRVRAADGEIHELRDQDVRNLPDEPMYMTPEQRAEYDARKKANRARGDGKDEPKKTTRRRK